MLDLILLPLILFEAIANLVSFLLFLLVWVFGPFIILARWLRGDYAQMADSVSLPSDTSSSPQSTADDESR